MRLRFIVMAILLILGLLTSLFSTNKLTRFCLYTPLKVLLISLVIVLILWFVSDDIFVGNNMKQYMDIGDKELFFYPFFVCFNCSIASYSIFLCKINVIRGSFLLSLVCFLLLPLFIAILIVLPQLQSKEYYIQTAYYLLAFVLPQIYFFSDFWRKNKRGEWMV